MMCKVRAFVRQVWRAYNDVSVSTMLHFRTGGDVTRSAAVRRLNLKSEKIMWKKHFFETRIYSNYATQMEIYWCSFPLLQRNCSGFVEKRRDEQGSFRCQLLDKWRRKLVRRGRSFWWRIIENDICCERTHCCMHSRINKHHCHSSNPITSNKC